MYLYEYNCCFIAQQNRQLLPVYVISLNSWPEEGIQILPDKVTGAASAFLPVHRAREKRRNSRAEEESLFFNSPKSLCCFREDLLFLVEMPLSKTL